MVDTPPYMPVFMDHAIAMWLACPRLAQSSYSHHHQGAGGRYSQPLRDRTPTAIVFPYSVYPTSPTLTIIADSRSVTTT